MKISVVLIWLCLSPVQLLSPDDQHVVENSVQSDVWTELRDTVVKLQAQVKSSEMKIKELEQRNAGRPNVAFSFVSGLNGQLGPMSSDTILVFQKPILNIGRAFNPITGVFTAPLRGVYYFRFNVLGYSQSYWTCIQLFKNNERIIEASEPPTGNNQYASAGITLLLNHGDHVYLKLMTDCATYDNSNNHSSISGFLVFPI